MKKISFEKFPKELDTKNNKILLLGHQVRPKNDLSFWQHHLKTTWDNDNPN